MELMDYAFYKAMNKNGGGGSDSGDKEKYPIQLEITDHWCDISSSQYRIRLAFCLKPVPDKTKLTAVGLCYGLSDFTDLTTAANVKSASDIKNAGRGTYVQTINTGTTSSESNASKVVYTCAYATYDGVTYYASKQGGLKTSEDSGVIYDAESWNSLSIK